MYQYVNGSLPISFNAFFTKLSYIHNYDTRNKSNYNPTIEIKRSLLTKQLELWDQSYGTR